MKAMYVHYKKFKSTETYKKIKMTIIVYVLNVQMDSCKEQVLMIGGSLDRWMSRLSYTHEQ